LTFPTVPAGFTGSTYARFRLSTDAAAANPTGAASDGEVEDYQVTIVAPSDGTVKSQVKISDGLGGLPADPSSGWKAGATANENTIHAQRDWALSWRLPAAGACRSRAKRPGLDMAGAATGRPRWPSTPGPHRGARQKAPARWAHAPLGPGMHPLRRKLVQGRLFGAAPGRFVKD
jgi:hypothetical protein